jgi:preprotein translocase subunit SecA
MRLVLTGGEIMDRMGMEEEKLFNIRWFLIRLSVLNAKSRKTIGTRKRLIEYDDIMNIQRIPFYRRRKNALFGERLH